MDGPAPTLIDAPAVRWPKDSRLHPRQWQGMTQTRRRYERRVGERAARAQAGREREFANLYRVNDAARGLSDEDFGEVLKRTQPTTACVGEQWLTWSRGGSRIHAA